MTRSAFVQTTQGLSGAYTKRPPVVTSMRLPPGSRLHHAGDVRRPSGYAQAATEEMSTILAMLYVLLGFSVVMSLFGRVNTLALSRRGGTPSRVSGGPSRVSDRV